MRLPDVAEEGGSAVEGGAAGRTPDLGVGVPWVLVAHVLHKGLVLERASAAQTLVVLFLGVRELVKLHLAPHSCPELTPAEAADKFGESVDH